MPLQVSSDLEVCKLAELDYSSAYLGVIGIFDCGEAPDIQATYAQYQSAITRVTQAGCREI
jgi:hypothetical protein